MGDRVRTYNPSVLNQLITDAASIGRASPSAQDGDTNPANEQAWPTTSMMSSSLWERTQAQRQARAAAQQAKDEAFFRATQEKKQAMEEARESAFQEDYGSVLAGLACSSGKPSPAHQDHVMEETQRVLDHKQKIKHSKQTALYQEWNTEVFDKMQRRLQTAVGKRSTGDISKRMQRQMSDYLNVTNTKLGVFRDVIIEDDYDPLSVRQHTIQVYTGDIRDPVKRDVLKPVYERALMGVSSLQDTQPLGKNTLDTKRWGTLAISATPYGHNVDTTGNTVLVPTSSQAEAARKSHIFLDHYNYPLADNQAVLEELGKPGKRAGTGPEELRGRKNLYDVIQHTCGLRPEFTGGDAWLEARGKGHAMGPEQLRGRADLTEVLHQTSNPYVDGRSLGDQWLEARGKAHPPGPEQLRGRADLAEIIQQSSNPYKDGRSLGDQWLETRGKGPLPGPQNKLREFLFRDNCPPDPAKVKDPRRYRSVMVNDKTLCPRT